MGSLLWALVGAACLGAELLTLSFVLVYFGVGALAAAGAGLLGAPLAGQVLVFAVVALGLLAGTRRPLLRLVQTRTPALTNVHAMIGKTGIVTIPISNDESTGQIRIGTEFWTARAIDDGTTTIPLGAKVDVIEVKGVTARVRPRLLASLEPAEPAP